MDFKIHPYQKGQEQSINKLIRKVFDEYVAPDYEENGNQFFYDFIDPEKLAVRQKDQINLYVAIVDNEIVGMIETRDDSHITLLFVDKTHHKKGIAKALIRTALNASVSRNKEIDRFTVNSSPISIPVYQRLGFVATGEMDEKNGIKFLPMEIEVTSFGE